MNSSALRRLRDIFDPAFDSAELEQEFRLTHYQNQRQAIRNYAIVAALVVLFFGQYDYQAYGADFWKPFLYRLFISAGSTLFLAGITYHPRYPAVARQLNGIVTIFFSVTGQGLIVLLYLGPMSIMTAPQACVNMILVIVYTTVGFWVTPLYTLLNCGLAVIIYFLLGEFIFHEATAVVVVYSLNLAASGVLAIIFAIQRERIFRENFLLNRNLDVEKREAERFLFQLVPADAVDKIKRGDAVADLYEEASVIFCDMVGFTRMSARQSPADLIVILNNLFNVMDEIANETGVEKVKTIGDSFMGIVKQSADVNLDESSAVTATDFGLKVIAAIEAAAREHRLDIQMRVGINTGSVIGGVVGSSKFYYDYWGDAVNVASRMQSTGAPGRVHVAEPTYDLAQGRFRFEPRGQVEVRGKGTMNTFFVAGYREAALRDDGPATAAPPVGASGIAGLAQSCIAWVTAPPTAVRPPSTTYWPPVMLLARSEHRKRTMLAISSGVV
jgi:class 3 adenylate cyclase